MKKIFSQKWSMLLMVTLLGLLFSCSSDEKDSRAYQDAKIVGVKVDGKLQLPAVANNVATVVLTSGYNLTQPRIEVLVSNGRVLNLENGTKVDCSKPLKLSILDDNGKTVEWTLRVQSPPKITSFLIEGMSIDMKDVHFGDKSLIVQVPKGTNLTALKVSMDFINGTVQDFTNGKAMDYTLPKTFTIKGVDDETIYSYTYIITTDPVGPAFVKSMTLNGVVADSIVVSGASGNILTPYVKGIIDFSKVDINITAGFGNIIDPSAVTKGLNLVTGTNKVKITGTDGIQKEFTLGVPQLSIAPIFSKSHADLGFGTDGGTAVDFSGNFLVVANHNTANAANVPIGPNYFDLTGSRVNALSKTGSNIDGGAVTGVRKLTADDEGVILGVQLGAGAGAATTLTIYKWNNVTADPTPYITYSQTSLGLAYAPRAAGISVVGSISKDAKIVVPIAQKQDVLIWTVTGGVLNPTPQITSYPFAGNSYYWSVQPMPMGKTGFVAMGINTSANNSGIISLSSGMASNFIIAGLRVTDCDVIDYKGRTYLAYSMYVSGAGARFRVCDITDGSQGSFTSPIFDVLMPSSAVEGNCTQDACFAVINGKLNVAFMYTNIGLRLYQLEQ